MRKESIRLLAAARQGNAAARLEIGRRYLLGSHGLPRHVQLGLEYLEHDGSDSGDGACCVIAECLPLHEIVREGRLPALRRAAEASSQTAMVKLGVWLVLSSADARAAMRWFDRAAALGSAVGCRLLAALATQPRCDLGPILAIMSGEPDFDAEALLELSLEVAMARGDGSALGALTDVSLQHRAPAGSSLPGLVCKAVVQGHDLPAFHMTAPAEDIERVLDEGARLGNADAALLLGRALCGVKDDRPIAASLTRRSNMRRGAALLLRAADAGCTEGWMQLYLLHSDHRASVANPQMARFFLEKAAVCGDATARRLLGALILRSATTLVESEQAIHWLHAAASAGDAMARSILETLVLPVAGSDEDAAEIIDAMHRRDPWLASRLRVARAFGLTKLEGLSADVVAGQRPWGLVVGPNPFVSKAKLAAPRAVPALGSESLIQLDQAVATMRQIEPLGRSTEGNLRQRSTKLRRLLQRYAGHEELFFAEARSSTLDTLRSGPKWAYHAREHLRHALVV